MSMQAKPKAYVPCCVPPSPHPYADMTDPHGDGGHVGGAELPDGVGCQQLYSLQAHSQPQGHRPEQRWTKAHQTANDAPPGRSRGSAHAGERHARADAGWRTPEPARAEAGRQPAGMPHTPAAALQVAVLEAGGEGRAGLFG